MGFPCQYNPLLNSPPPASTGFAIPESLYLEAVALKSRRPSGRGPREQVFIRGVKRAATLHKSDKVTSTQELP